MNKLNLLDYMVFVAVLCVTAYSIYFGNKSASDNTDGGFLDRLLMGRKLTVPLFTATLVATWYGGIFGVTQIAFEKGLYNFLTQGVFWYATYIIFALFIAKRAWESQSLTLAQMVGQRFGRRSEVLASIFNIMNVVPVAYMVSLGLLISQFFPVGMSGGMFIGGAIVVTYSMFGGFRAVIYSDLVQFVVMFLSVIFVIFISYLTYGGSSYLFASLPKTHFSALSGTSLSQTLVWGLIALSTLIDPVFYQRCFAAKDPKTAKKGIFLSIGFWVVFDLCTTFGGMYARAAMPEAESASAYLDYALSILPSGLRGLFLAGIVATILSTIDSYFHVASSSICVDLLPSRVGEKRWVFNLCVALVAVLAFLIGNGFEGNIKSIWKTFGSYSAGCLLFPVMFGYVYRGKIPDRLFVVSALLGAIAITFWRLVSFTPLQKTVDDLYVGVGVTGLCLGVGVIFVRQMSANNEIS